MIPCAPLPPSSKSDRKPSRPIKIGTRCQIALATITRNQLLATRNFLPSLRTIPDLAEAFHVPLGISDSTLGIAFPVTAVALGACIIEKRLALRRSNGGQHVNLMPFAVLNEFPSDWKTRAKQKCYGQLTVIVPCVEDLLISKLKRGEPRDKLHAQ